MLHKFKLKIININLIKFILPGKNGTDIVHSLPHTPLYILTYALTLQTGI